jgi:hypothetical protein
LVPLDRPGGDLRNSLYLKWIIAGVMLMALNARQARSTVCSSPIKGNKRETSVTWIKTQLGILAAAFLAVGYSMPAPATAASVSIQIPSDATDFSAARRGGGGGARAARPGGGGRSVNRSANVNRNVNRNVSRNANVNRNVNRNTNVNRNVNRNVNVNRRTNVVVRPVRPWVHRPYFGTVVGGIALGTIVAASVAGTVPVAPAANMCWYWVDSAQVQGYWDYCTPPY